MGHSGSFAEFRGEKDERGWGFALAHPRLSACRSQSPWSPHGDVHEAVGLFIADDQAWNDVGCYGHPSIRTPNIDRLGQEGMKFEYAFLTCASCSPTRCSVITGRYPHSTGARELHQPLPANQITFPGLLKQAGYYTASAGKWHLGKDAEKNFDKVVQGGGPSGCEKWLDTLAYNKDGGGDDDRIISNFYALLGALKGLIEVMADTQAIISQINWDQWARARF